MTAPAPDELREKVARVIDPEAWDEISAEDNDEAALIFEEAWAIALAKADLLLSLPEPFQPQEGWKVVPEEPTEEMVGAGAYVASQDPAWTVRDIYRAMLSAAPAARVPISGWKRGDAVIVTVPDLAEFHATIIEPVEGWWRVKFIADGSTSIRPPSQISVPPVLEQGEG